jgi:DNA-binding NarL/FixJ family response regulator
MNRVLHPEREKEIQIMTSTEANSTTEATAVAPQGAHVAPKVAKTTRKATPKAGASRAALGARKAAKKNAPATPKPSTRKMAKTSKRTKPTARDGSKKRQVLQLLQRDEGVSAKEIARITNWQPHTIRGFVSTISKKMKLAVESARDEQRERVYKLCG